jgi:CBS domain-containing protein
MNIASLCTRPIVSIGAGASLREAAALMRRHHVGSLVVTTMHGERQVATGIVTDRDLLLELLGPRWPAEDVVVGAIPTRKLVAVPGAAGVTEAVATMAEAGVRRLLVTDEEGRLAGLVSADDLLDALAKDLSQLAGAYRAGIARESAERPPVEPGPRHAVFMPHGTPGMHL